MFQVCRDGAWVENKGALLTFHYRETPPEVRPLMIVKAKELIVKYGFKPVEATCAIEAKPPTNWNKGMNVISNSVDFLLIHITFSLQFCKFWGNLR